MARRRKRILAAIAALAMMLCAAVIAGSLLAMWRLPVRQDWALFNAQRGYISAAKSTKSASTILILDGDGIAFERYGRLEAADVAPGWQFNFNDRALYRTNVAIAPFQPQQTRTWIDGAGLYLFTGTALDPSRPSRRAHTLIARVPYWLIVTMAAVLPLWIALKFLLRRQRYGAGQCPNCGYDLRATPTRCPECGAEFHEPQMNADERR